MRIKYRRITVEIPNVNKPTRCECCGKIPKPRGMQMHHTKYAYETKEVKKNPKLALENTIPLCTYCHRVGNAIRIIEENTKKATKIIEILMILKALIKKN